VARIDNLARWRKWKAEVQDLCPIAVPDKTICRMAICPCRRLKLYEFDKWYMEKMEPWFKTGAGRIGGMVKIGRVLTRRKEKDGNG